MMTQPLDTHIRKICAEMMRDVLRSADAVEVLRALDEIATAPVVAKAGDGIDPLVKDVFVHGTAFVKTTFDEKTGTTKAERIDPAKVASPSEPADPFAPMVEAASLVFEEVEKRTPGVAGLRRALAAALRAAPCTEAMRLGWIKTLATSSGSYYQAWRAMADALADEIGGGK